MTLMEERSENGDGKMEEIMLPGFRFHPTDEELVGFYLKRKIQQRPLSIELIKQLDIYKHDPWDLPKLAATGEKEWYFYCPRDRKYRNSARPNRVTGAGFWKATGTDRPIYSSEGSKCIGLKKSLVFYKGRAAKGMKTDWMMHEFRLPSLTDHTTPPTKRFIEKTIPPNESWAICRIFKKANSSAHRALSHSWVSSSDIMLPETPPSSHIHHQYAISNIINDTHHSSITTFSPNLNHNNNNNNTNISLYKAFNTATAAPNLTTNDNTTPQNSISSSEDPNHFSTVDAFNVPSSNIYYADFGKASSLVEGNLDYMINNGFHHHHHYLNGNSSFLMQEKFDHQQGIRGMMLLKSPLEAVDTNFEGQSSGGGGFPLMSLPLMGIQDAWKPSFLCDSSCEISTGSTTNKNYM